jgi:acyl-CoA thioesterase FadM
VRGDGAVCPGDGIFCQIKSSTRFGDEVQICAKIRKYNGVRLHFEYVVSRPDGSLVATGVTEHCFLNGEGKVIALKKNFRSFIRI